jgi:hypothetical protein
MPQPSVKSPRLGAQSAEQFRELQRVTLSAVIRPLTSGLKMQPTWTDGRRTSAIADKFIKPNDRLSSFERLEIYNRQYWFRVLDCLYDDYPGLRAILGENKFRKLRIAYLEKYPSASFTLRDLGSRLEQFLIERPELTHPHQQMALDMARFEWAQVVAFDGQAFPALAVDDLLGVNPTKLRLQLQPYLTLLDLGYPLDDFVIGLKRRDAALRSEASNAMDTSENESRGQKASRIRRPTKQRSFLVVHRYDNALYYKRLEPQAYQLLTALRDGATLADACDIATNGGDDTAEETAAQIGAWFKLWAGLGWFCKTADRSIREEPGRPRPGPGRGRPARLSSPKSGSPDNVKSTIAKKFPAKQLRRKAKRSKL